MSRRSVTPRDLSNTGSPAGFPKTRANKRRGMLRIKSAMLSLCLCECGPHSPIATGVRCTVPSHLRIRSGKVDRAHVRSLQFKIGDKIFDPALCKSRDFYGLLISSKASESRGFIKLKSKFSLVHVETKRPSH